MRHSLRQKFANYFGPVYHGMTLKQWLNIFTDKELKIDWPYWYRILPTTLKSMSNSLLRMIEQDKFAKQIENVSIAPPLIILGHWRSGTTLLQNIFARDERFAFPNLYQVLNPYTFLISEETLITRFFSLLIPRQRLFDKLPFSLKVPHEDEFIFWNSSGLSSYMTWNFPRSAPRFDKYLTFRKVSDPERELWKSDLVLFLKKLAFKYHKPLVLKSPQHTARIPLLLEIFPEAKFIHIYRDPYRIFQSTLKLNEFVLHISTFQKADSHKIKQRIINQYKEMYDCYFADRKLIPQGHLIEIQFEKFEANPLLELKRIYADLALPDFKDIEEDMQMYLHSLGDYKKNIFPTLSPELKHKVYSNWERNFRVWSYPA